MHQSPPASVAAFTPGELPVLEFAPSNDIGTSQRPLAANHLSALTDGARLNSYIVGEVLGAGGFGITYKAREDVTEREVAIKEYLPAALATRDGNGISVRPLSTGAARDFEWGLDRFRQEAKLLIDFHHPNIVPVLSYFEANGTGYLVMEFQAGTSLAEILRAEQTMSEADVLRFIVPLLDGVEEVHRHGLIHRDIKPENILIRRDGTPVLLDFGAARRALGERSRKLTTILTEGYAPFEQYAGTESQGASSDIYALAAVMFHALTGRSPAGAPVRATARLGGKADPMAKELAALRARISSDVAFVIEAGLRVVDKERPQTVAAFRELLVPAPLSAARVQSATATPSVITLVPDLTKRSEDPRYPPPWRPAPHGRTRRARRPVLFAAIILGAVGLAVLAGDPLDSLGSAPKRSEVETAQRPAALRREDSGKPERPPSRVDEQPGGEDPELERRKEKALVEYQQRQLDWIEEERRHTLAAIRAAEAERQRAAEAERQRAAEPEAKKRTETVPPPPQRDAEFPNPLRGLRVW
jgi:serine/threonine protein kinase